jgi:gamma-glutamylcyclotransferase (GGCT)/AIG2-like uncharacterized protein YtfP
VAPGDVLLFVYGTLMPGETRWRHLSPYALSWVPATARGSLWDTGSGYPAAKFDDHADELPGLLVSLRPDVAELAIQVLDRVEGSLYRRVKISTSRGNAFSYEWLGPTDGLRLLPNGWRPQP